MSVVDLEVSIGGRLYFVRRSMDVARRVETAVGAIWPFARRIEAVEVQFAEMSRLYAALLRDEPHGPDLKSIDAWLFEAGLHDAAHQRAAWFLTTLVVGSRILEQEQSRIAAAASRVKTPEDGDPRGPFVPTGASTSSS